MRKLLALSAVIAVIVFACTPKAAPVQSNVPKTSFATDVNPIIQNNCSPCHIPSKGGRMANFDSYDSSKKYITSMIVRVQLDPSDVKFMPFKLKKPALTAAQIQTLKNWQLNGSE
jgi:hypothetical protein